MVAENNEENGKHDLIVGHFAQHEALQTNHNQ